MPNPRYDTAGTWHHVMNRAVGKRVLFENSRDIRFFLAQIARTVRAGLLEVHAYSVLPTHFHLLVRSPAGRLSDAMRNAEFAYVKYFNRAHDRDGHLVQGRFRSRPVRSTTYQHVLVGYIDWNAVDARLVDDPFEYPYSSAWHFARAKGPPWLERSWIEDVVRREWKMAQFSPATYRSTIGARPTRGRLRIVLPRLSAPPTEDDLDDLIGAAPARLREWFRRRAEAADGMSLGPPLVDEDSVADGVRSIAEDWMVSPRGHARRGHPILHAALLRTLSRLTSSAIARRLGLSWARVADAFAAHRELMKLDSDYAGVLVRVAEEAIRRCHGASRPDGSTDS
jgi:hypothetical protein